MTWFKCCCCCKRKMNKKKNSTIPRTSHVHKEGVMLKRCGIIKMWKPRYFLLLDDVLCYFMKEEHKESWLPTGRIFFSDIDLVDRVNKKGHPYALQIITDSKTQIFCCDTFEDREDWMNKIFDVREKHKSQEQLDPVRRRSTRLGKESKRITIKKDPKHGIGCTIKNVGGAIFVSRIIPDGPVATSGVLRPGDQIIDINGNRVSECPIERIKEIIRSSPDYVVCTVKPVTHYVNRESTSPSVKRTAYTEVDPDYLKLSDGEEIPITSSEGSGVKKYTEVNFRRSEESVLLLDEGRESQPSNPDANYMNYGDFEYDQDHGKVTKKLTNYAELEFNSRR